MSRPVKCPKCQETFVREQCEWTQYKNRYYHQDCYAKELQEKQTQKKETSKEVVNQLHDYLCRINKYEKVPARVVIQINQMKKQYGYTDSGILKTLEYFYEVKKGSAAKSNGGVGIVPYVYDDAKDHYYKIYMAQESNKEKDITHMVQEGRVIHISPPKRKSRKVKLFNMDIEEDNMNGK